MNKLLMFSVLMPAISVAVPRFNNAPSWVEMQYLAVDAAVADKTAFQNLRPSILRSGRYGMICFDTTDTSLSTSRMAFSGKTVQYVLDNYVFCFKNPFQGSAGISLNNSCFIVKLVAD